MSSGISFDTPQVVRVVFWWPEPRAVRKQLDQKTQIEYLGHIFPLNFTSIGKKSPKIRGIKLCRSPNGECVDGIEDICLGEVEDDVSVKVPDLQDALLVAPEDFLCDFDAM